MDSLLIPNPAEPDAPSVNFTPDIKEVARSTRSVRSDATEPAEIRESDHPEPGTRFDAPTRSVRSETSLDLPGAGLFAGLTDGDRERAASSSIGDGGEADGDDTIEPPPCPEQSPLRGLDPLAAGPDAAVPVTAGEKSAEAASTMFPNVVCTTSRGGSKAPHRSGRIPLHRRQLTFLLDQDEAGASSAAKVGDRTTPAGVVSKRALAVPHNSPKGRDLTDPAPDGVAPGRPQEPLDDAPDGTAAKLPSGFRMTLNGLFFDPEPTRRNPEPTKRNSEPAERNPKPVPIFICAPFRVLGETRNDVGEAWGVFLRWDDREGTPHQWAIPRRLIHRQGHEIAEELEAAGLSCGPDSRAHDLLKRCIGGVKAPRLLRCVTRTGWHQGNGKPVFVLPGGEAFGPGAADVILQADIASADAAYRAAGDLAGWQSGVASLAVGNDRLVLFVSAAFAGPLLDVLAEPSGGIHLVGRSRIGKTTAVLLAASVWGKPTADAQLRAWRGTANGLEGTAVATSDTVLILDEMGQADAREVGDVIYLLANEAGKQRASRTGSARQRQSWRTLFLSTGEVTLAQKMGEVGKKAMAGLDVRLVNLPADAGVGKGVFQDLHGRPDAATLAEELKNACRAHYGIAAPKFLSRLAQDRATDPATLRATLDERRAAFLDNYLLAGASGQVRSVAGRFALIAVAGELAQDYGILPWQCGEAVRAAGACFMAWLAERGGAGWSEDAAALAQVRRFLEAHGESRFTLVVPPGRGAGATLPDTARTINRAGYRQRAEGEGERWEYMILPETWRAEVCNGLDAKRTADLLIERGFLLGATSRNRSALVTIPGEGKRRVYRVSGAILAGDTAEADADGAD